MRATDADRDATSVIVAAATSDGRLTIEEMHERLERVFAARTHGDLAALTRDLVREAPYQAPTAPYQPPATPYQAPATPYQAPTAPYQAPASPYQPPTSAFQRPAPAYPTPVSPYQPFSGIAGRTTAIAIFGGVERSGAWSVPGRLQVVAVMGGAQIDLTSAVFEQPYTTINVVTIMGGVEIIAPPHVRVVSNVVAILGGCSNRADDGAGAYVVHVTGTALFGGVDVRRPGAGTMPGLPGQPSGPSAPPLPPPGFRR